VETAANTPFLSNMKLAITGSGFSFIPDTLLALYGDNSTSFRIGADGNAIS